MTSNDTSVLCRMSQLATLPWNEEFYLIWSCECVLSSFACVPCVATMPDPFRGFVNHTIVYSSVTGTRLKIGQNCNISTSLKTHANLGKNSPPETTFTFWFHFLGKYTPPTCLFLHSLRCMLSRLAFSKDRWTASLVSLKKNVPTAQCLVTQLIITERKGKAIRHRFDLLA